MEIPAETMLEANGLIHRYGAGAEEYASQQLWNFQQSADEEKAARWRTMLEAIKKVRELRSKAAT